MLNLYTTTCDDDNTTPNEMIMLIGCDKAAAAAGDILSLGKVDKVGEHAGHVCSQRGEERGHRPGPKGRGDQVERGGGEEEEEEANGMESQQQQQCRGHGRGERTED